MDLNFLIDFILEFGVQPKVHEMDKDCLEFIRERIQHEFPYTNETFEKWVLRYELLDPFKISENVEVEPEVHFIMRMASEYYMLKVFDAMKIDMSDPNVMSDISTGNIGTPGRIIKSWVGKNNNDLNELLSARWCEEPRMATFPNDKQIKDPVFVTTKIDAVCSHHLIRFGDDGNNESSVVIGYIPELKLGGISKINRFVEWCSRRGWLQEDLTNYIGEKIKEVFETRSVYVRMFGMKHGCASYRGVKDRESSTSTTFISGEFKKNPSIIPKRFR